MRGLGRAPHTELCRERFKKLMSEEARVENAERKRKEYDEKMREKEREEREKKKTKTEGGFSEGGATGSGEVKKRRGEDIEEMEAKAAEERSRKGSRRTRRKRHDDRRSLEKAF